MMNAINFKKVERKNTPILISLSGRSGSGKTYSALRLARGLVGPEGKIFLADTERGRASLYADTFDFDGIEINPPYTSQKHIDVIEAAEKGGADVLIIDTMSHEWSGIGGVKDIAEKVIMDRGEKASLVGWAKGKGPHKKLVDRMTQSSIHIICCLRAEHKCVSYRENGKLIITETADLVPEQEKRFVYEMTISAIIDEKTHQAKFVKLPEPVKNSVRDGQMIDEATGEALRAWVDAGLQPNSAVEYNNIYQQGQSAAAQGIKNYQDFFTSLNTHDKLKIKDSGDHDKFKKTAQEIDATNSPKDGDIHTN